ncbi:MAG: response regulator [Nitrospirae bacterium]|uniref:ATP-binding protein n=1 Tax=Candidatus Magnetobacterium casense TaxID=1455061 RepID=UPI000696505F|nr:ATP-binding protein [Candidatus Magnetobacterium casensis]MBF0337502.1 response regulator [Nitrospirota bacterium]
MKKIKTKLFLYFLSFSVFLWGAIYLAISISVKAFEASIVSTHIDIYERYVEFIDHHISDKIDFYRLYSTDAFFRQFVDESNTRFDNIDNVGDYIDEKDKEWMQVPKNVITPFMADIINNPLSKSLKHQIEHLKKEQGYYIYSEVFVTNKHGANVAQTGKTSDYFQADEQWWQTAKKEGFYIGAAEYDDSSETYALPIGIAITDSKGNFSGVIKLVFNLKNIIDMLKEMKNNASHKQYAKWRLGLFTRDGKKIYSPDNINISEDVKKHLLQSGSVRLRSIDKHWGDSLSIYVINQDNDKNVIHLGWMLVNEHATDELFAQVRELRMLILLSAIVVTLFAMFSSLYLSRRISRPLLLLTNSVNAFDDNNLCVDIPAIQSRDEIGQLTGAFTRMTEKLRYSIIQRDEINKGLELKTDEIKKNYDLQNVISTLLKQSYRDLSIEEFLDLALDILLSLPWLAAKSTGCIFLYDEATRVLKMQTSRNLDSATLELCKEVQAGRCLCGLAVSRRELIHKDLIDGEHEIIYEGITEHGNYCVPIITRDSTLGVINVNIDAGHGKDKTEEQLLLMFADTLAAIIQRKRTDEKLLAAMQEAESANRAKTDFLANMSHEIRTPMNAIVGLGHLALQTDLSAKQRDYLTKIQSSAKSLLAIINDMLDLSKIEAGKLELEIIGFDLRNVLDNIVTMLAARAEEKGIEIILSADKDVPSLLIGDPLRIGQVLTNLLSNALKFTEQGEIAITVKVVAIDKEEVTLGFSVRDTGIGIALEMLPNLFQPFLQADRSTTRKYGGTGLGLSICKKLVELMNGDICIRSEYGKGSEFTFTIKAGYQQQLDTSNDMKALDKESERSARRHEYNATAMEKLAAIQGARLLLVEDNYINQQVAFEVLSNAGFVVDIANNGLDAVRAIEMAPKKYGAVLMDIQMHEMDGIEATRRIRQLTSELPVIAMTAHVMKAERDKCYAAGMNDHVSKPIDIKELCDTLLRWVRPTVSDVPDVESAPPRQGETTPVYNLPGIDIAAALERIGGNRDLLKKIIVYFKDNNVHIANDIEAAIERSDYSQARDLVHGLKGMAGNISATELFGVVKELEDLLIKEDPAVIYECLKRVDKELHTVFESAGTFEKLTGNSKPVPTDIPVECRDLTAIVIELDSLLRQHSMQARKFFAENRTCLMSVAGEKDIDQLSGCIDKLDFKAAVAVLNGIAVAIKK